MRRTVQKQTKKSPAAAKKKAVAGSRRKKPTRKTTARKKKSTETRSAVKIAKAAAAALEQDLQKIDIDDDELTARRGAFVNEMLVDNNGTQAAIRAGFAPKSAAAMASILLRDPKVAAALQKARDARAERTNVTADRVLLELARIGLADVRDVFIWDERRTAFVPSRDLTTDQAAAIQGIESRSYITYLKDGSIQRKNVLKVRTHDKNAALKEIGKHLGIEQRLAVRRAYDDAGDLTDAEVKERRLAAAKELVKRNNKKSKR